MSPVKPLSLRSQCEHWLRNPFSSSFVQGYYGFPRRFAPRNDRQGSAAVRSNFNFALSHAQ